MRVLILGSLKSVISKKMLRVNEKFRKKKFDYTK